MGKKVVFYEGPGGVIARPDGTGGFYVPDRGGILPYAVYEYGGRRTVRRDGKILRVLEITGLLRERDARGYAEVHGAEGFYERVMGVFRLGVRAVLDGLLDGVEPEEGAGKWDYFLLTAEYDAWFRGEHPEIFEGVPRRSLGFDVAVEVRVRHDAADAFAASLPAWIKVSNRHVEYSGDSSPDYGVYGAVGGGDPENW